MVKHNRNKEAISQNISSQLTHRTQPKQTSKLNQMPKINGTRSYYHPYSMTDPCCKTCALVDSYRQQLDMMTVMYSKITIEKINQGQELNQHKEFVNRYKLVDMEQQAFFNILLAEGACRGLHDWSGFQPCGEIYWIATQQWGLWDKVHPA